MLVHCVYIPNDGIFRLVNQQIYYKHTHTPGSVGNGVEDLISSFAGVETFEQGL